MSKYVYEVYGLKDEHKVVPIGTLKTSTKNDDSMVETFIFDEKTGEFVSTGYKKAKFLAYGNFAKLNGDIVFILEVKDISGGSWG